MVSAKKGGVFVGLKRYELHGELDFESVLSINSLSPVVISNSTRYDRKIKRRQHRR